MPTQIDQDAVVLLEALASEPRDSYVSGAELSQKTGLEPDRINDAMSLLVDSGLAEWLQVMGTAPYDLGDATITSRGRYELQRATEAAAAQPASASVAAAATSAIHPPSPVGSPYGFTDEDWEIVSERKAQQGILRVALGYQFRSEHYDSEMLKRNIRAAFEGALVEYHDKQMGPPVTLEMSALGAGYGEHLFNEIARDIISSDIAVFDASDLNPNVMLEMGVALTWGVRVLPIKAAGRPSPPSDISGQTWVEYEASAARFLDGEHQAKIARMVQRAVKKKGKGTA